MIVNQVVRFAVYVYFTLSLIASQEVSRDPYTFVPIFLILKVGESLLSPSGDLGIGLV